MNNTLNFITIDDDPICNLLNSTIIQKAYPEATVVEFTSAEDGLAYFARHHENPIKERIVVLLDINMPVMNGWDFLDEYDKLDDGIKQRTRIVIVSSSIDASDHARAKTNIYVRGLIRKPLTRDSIPELEQFIGDL